VLELLQLEKSSLYVDLYREATTHGRTSDCPACAALPCVSSSYQKQHSGVSAP
jgi:hypothetical protein